MEHELQIQNLDASGTAVAKPCRVVGLYIRHGSAGHIALRNGGSAGTIKAMFTTGNTVIGTYINLGANYLRFETDCYVTINGANCRATVVYYQ